MGIFLSFEDRNKTENDINDFLGKNVLFIHVHRLLKEGDILRNFQRTTCFTDLISPIGTKLHNCILCSYVMQLCYAVMLCSYVVSSRLGLPGL